MSDATRVHGTVAVQPDSKERVAYELMDRISTYEDKDRGSPRRYWFELYLQCLRTVEGQEPGSNLHERPRRS